MMQDIGYQNIIEGFIFKRQNLAVEQFEIDLLDPVVYYIYPSNFGLKKPLELFGNYRRSATKVQDAVSIIDKIPAVICHPVGRHPINKRKYLIKHYFLKPVT